MAGYKDVNDAARMSIYSVMRAITGKIGAKVVRYSRYIAFQMAGVAISRKLFAEILLRILRYVVAKRKISLCGLTVGE